MAIMEGSDPVEKWRNNFLPSYKANLAIWPFVQGVNFTFVPLEFRVLVVNVVALGMRLSIYAFRIIHADGGQAGTAC